MGGSYFSSGKAFSASREGGEMIVVGTIAVQSCVTQTTVVCEVKVGRDLGHTPGHGRDVLVSWPASLRGCSWSSGEFNRLVLMPEGPKLKLALPCGRWA